MIPFRHPIFSQLYQIYETLSERRDLWRMRCEEAQRRFSHRTYLLSQLHERMHDGTIPTETLKRIDEMWAEVVADDLRREPRPSAECPPGVPVCRSVELCSWHQRYREPYYILLLRCRRLREEVRHLNNALRGRGGH